MSNVIEFRKMTISRLLYGTNTEQLAWQKGEEYFAFDDVTPDFCLYINESWVTIDRRSQGTKHGSRKVIEISLLDDNKEEYDNFSDYDDTDLAPSIRALYQSVENTVRGLTANYKRLLSGLPNDEIPF